MNFQSFAKLSLFLAGFSVSLVQAAAEGGALNIGMVDLQFALQNVEAGKQAKSQLEKEMLAKKQLIEKTQASLQKEMEEADKNAAIMNEAARAKKNAELQKKIAAFQKTYQDSQMDMQKRERELTQPIIEELRTIVQGLAKAQNLQLVLEKNSGAVLFVKDERDITKEVVEAFNSRKKGKKS